MWGSKVHGGEGLTLICEGLELSMCLEFIIDLDLEGLKTCETCQLTFSFEAQ
jgi:hypothetical protein